MEQWERATKCLEIYVKFGRYGWRVGDFAKALFNDTHTHTRRKKPFEKERRMLLCTILSKQKLGLVQRNCCVPNDALFYLKLAYVPFQLNFYVVLHTEHREYPLKFTIFLVFPARFRIVPTMMGNRLAMNFSCYAPQCNHIGFTVEKSKSSTNRFKCLTNDDFMAKSILGSILNKKKIQEQNTHSQQRGERQFIYVGHERYECLWSFSFCATTIGNQLWAHSKKRRFTNTYELVKNRMLHYKELQRRRRRRKKQQQIFDAIFVHHGQHMAISHWIMFRFGYQQQ